MAITRLDLHRLMYVILYLTILGTAGQSALTSRGAAAWKAWQNGKPWHVSPQVEAWGAFALTSYLVVFVVISLLRALRVPDEKYTRALFFHDFLECILLLVAFLVLIFFGGKPLAQGYHAIPFVCLSVALFNQIGWRVIAYAGAPQESDERMIVRVLAIMGCYFVGIGCAFGSSVFWTLLGTVGLFLATWIFFRCPATNSM